MMRTTVFCTFERQDFADLAVGSLHEAGLDIISIHYIGPRPERESHGAINAVSLFPGDGRDEPVPSRPVTLKIVCPDEQSDMLVSKLINLHGYEIIKTR